MNVVERMAPTSLALLLHLYRIVASVAPGEKEQLFCEQLRAVEAAPIPAYSANMRVLMDSWNYQNLLPNRHGAVWDQVGNDGSNPYDITTNVSRHDVGIKKSSRLRVLIIIINYAVDSAVQHSMPTKCPSVWIQCWSTE